MTFRESCEWLDQIGELHIRLGLDRVRTVLDHLGRPDRACRHVHIAGTNGKGTTAFYTESLLAAAGVRTGLYTSPHLLSVCERVRIDGRDLAEEDFARHATRVRDACSATGTDLTYFEILTVIAFLAFAEQNVEVAVTEVGLGGRLDATNVIEEPICTVITSIARDHVAHLGETVEAIAAEKAAIVKAGVPVVCAVRDPAALSVVREHAQRADAPVQMIDEDFGSQGDTLFTPDLRVDDVVLSLPGARNRDNAATALAAAALARHSLEPTAVRVALAETHPPGRWMRSGRWILDGAHNPAAAAHLAAVLPETAPEGYALVYAAMKDKEHGAFLAALPVPRYLLLTQTAGARAAGRAQLEEAVPQGWPAATWCESPEEATQRALALPQNLPILVTGSLYLVGALLEALL